MVSLIPCHIFRRLSLSSSKYCLLYFSLLSCKLFVTTFLVDLNSSCNCSFQAGSFALQNFRENFFFSNFLRRPLLIQDLLCYIASSFFNFISRACFSGKVLIKFKSITREASRFLWFDFKVSCQSTCRSLLKVSYLNTLRFLLNCLLSFFSSV